MYAYARALRKSSEVRGHNISVHTYSVKYLSERLVTDNRRKQVCHSSELATLHERTFNGLGCGARQRSTKKASDINKCTLAYI
jgi:hypothetical protein